MNDLGESFTSEQVAEIIGIKPQTLAAWIARGHHSVPLMPTRRGQWRKFYRPNVYEFAYIAAFSRKGLPIENAARLGHDIIEAIQRREKFTFVAFNPTDFVPHFLKATDLISMSDIGDQPDAFMVLNVGKLLEVVDDRIDNVLHGASEGWSEDDKKGHERVKDREQVK